MNDIIETHKDYPKTVGKQIAFNIELMMSMLHAALNRALDLCDEAHFMELGRDTNGK